jgi:hypothetical protein
MRSARYVGRLLRASELVPTSCASDASAALPLRQFRNRHVVDRLAVDLQRQDQFPQRAVVLVGEVVRLQRNIGQQARAEHHRAQHLPLHQQHRVGPGHACSLGSLAGSRFAPLDSFGGQNFDQPDSIARSTIARGS